MKASAGFLRALTEQSALYWARIWIAIVGFTAMLLSADDIDDRSRIVEFNISRQSADKALIQFAEQANITLVFPFEEAARVTANPLNGRYTMLDALALLLTDTSLSTSVNDGQLNIVSIAKQEGKILPTSFLGRMIAAITKGLTAGNASAVNISESRDLQNVIEEVVVTAQRREQNSQDVGMTVSSCLWIQLINATH